MKKDDIALTIFLLLGILMLGLTLRYRAINHLPLDPDPIHEVLEDSLHD